MGQKNGFQYDTDKKYFDAKRSEAKIFYGMFPCGIMVIKHYKILKLRATWPKNRIK